MKEVGCDAVDDSLDQDTTKADHHGSLGITVVQKDASYARAQPHRLGGIFEVGGGGKGGGACAC